MIYTMGSISVNQILYPEVHLDSPIVTNKLVAILEYANLKHNYQLTDPTIIDNIRHRVNEGYSNQVIINHVNIGCVINDLLNTYPKITHIPYPECNQALFRADDPLVTQKLLELFKKGNVIYQKIAGGVVTCLTKLNQSLGLGNDIPVPLQKLIQDLGIVMHSSRWFEPFLFWFTIKTEMRSVIKSNTQTCQKRRYIPSFTTGKNFKILVSRDMVCLVTLEGGRVYYLTFEMVLMYCDVIEGRLMTDTAMSMDLKFANLYKRVHYLWDLIDGFFPDLGNANYQLVALLEPLSLAYLQLRDVTDQLKGAFLSHCFAEIKEILDQQGFTSQETYTNLTDALDTIFITDDVHLTGEIFSFFRSFGHPRLEAITAAENVRKHMNQPKVVSYETLMKGHAIFCGIIISGFRDRHGGSWPPLTLPEHASPVVRNAQTSGEGLTYSQCVDNWKSFVGIKFKCFMPLSLDSDLTMYLKDKALSALRKEWDSVYPKEYLRYNPPRSTSSRRLVNVFLEDSDFDPYNMIMYVISGEYLRDPEFNLSYSLKEKEIKEVGRLFAKMTYKMRACQVIAENLISNGIGKYFKDNGMAKDEHDLTKALHTLAVSGVPKDKSQKHRDPRVQKSHLYETKQQKAESDIHNRRFKSNKVKKEFICGRSEDNDLDLYETVSAFVTTDLKKYCLNWRYETISIYAQRLNEIYGLPCFFDWLHRRLEKSVLYVSDPHCPPDLDHHIDLDNVPNNQIFIKYPMGGIEGYCQKLWTISTIPYLYLAAHECGVRIASLVQGDNQTIAVTKRVPSTWPYPLKKTEAARVTVNYFMILRERLHDIGHHLKANETIISSHFFVYSKGIYYDGMLISQSLKSIARCVFWSETIVDETRAACSNISTTLAKSIEKGFDRYLAYALNLIKTIQQLLISLGFTINGSMTDDIVGPLLANNRIITKMALLPAPIGGFNYLNMSRLFVRNIGDPVTSSLADLKRMIKAGLLNEVILHQVMTQKPGDSSFLDWASDPYSANLPCTQSMTRVLKNVTARHVLINSPNPMLKGLFHNESQEEDESLAAFLMDRGVIIPRAAHEILDNTITGAREAIAGMLDTTKGLIRASMQRGGLTPRIITRLTTYDYDQFKTGMRLFMGKGTNLLIDQDSCSVQLARALRNHMWAALARGRPIYGLEVPDILESMRGQLIMRHESCHMCIQGSQNYGWFFVPANCQLDNITASTSSLRVPYIGSTTEERTDMKLSFVKSPSRSLKSAVRIATVYSWAYGDDDRSWNEAWHLAKQRANITLGELRMITPISTSTNLAHRLRDKSTQVKYSGTSLIRVARYTTISNDNLSFTIADKKVDTNFIYQQGMLLGLGVLEQLFRLATNTGQANTVLHLHVETECCVIPMTDHPTVPSIHQMRKPHTICTNPLIYDNNPIIEKDAIRIYHQHYRRQIVEFVTWSTNQLYHVLAKSTAMSMIELITKFEKDHLNEITTLIGDDDINSFITEFLLVEPRLFTVYLGQCAALNWAFEIHFHRPTGKYQMGELLFTFLSRMSKGVFKILVNALSHPRVYRRFWDSGMIEPVYGPSLDTQNLHRTVCNLIYNCYITYLDLILNNDTDDYPTILCESDEDVVSDRFDNIQARHLCIITDLYCDTKECPPIRGLPPTEKCKTLLKFLQTQSQLNPSGLAWNDQPILVDQYSCSLTYLRRGCIKQIRLRVDPGFVSDALSDSKGFQRDTVWGKSDRQLTHNLEPPSDDILTLIGSINTDASNIPVIGEGVRNYEIHAFRRLGVNSTACYKAVEIVSLIRCNFEIGDHGLFLGEGSGAMLVVYRDLLGLSKCYYNSGVSPDARAGQREISPYPSEVSLVEHKLGQERSVSVLFNGRPEVTWVGSVDCYKYILSQIPTGSLSIIHSDIESLPDKDIVEKLEELSAILSTALILGKAGSTLIIKIMPISGDWVYGFIKFALVHYLKGKIVYPRYSNYVSTECYLVFQGMRASRLVNPEGIKQQIMRIGTRTTPGLICHILARKQSTCIQSCLGSPITNEGFNINLKSLTHVEKLLVNCGFSINGDKVCRSLLHHDVISGCDGLTNAIIILYKELARFREIHLTSHGIFHAYPVLIESQQRELILDITRKIVGHSILYARNLIALTQVIRNLKSGYITIDLYQNQFTQNLSKSDRALIRGTIARRDWMFRLETKEIKEWFKLVGYSALISE